METREVLVANTRTQRRYKVTTNATTLSELKTALDNNDIAYNDMSFTEGISNTQLLDDSSILPNNTRKVKDKDGKEYGLVIILTNTKKDISSGAVSGERAELFAAIKENNLQNAVIQEFGKNMTQVSTAALKNFVHLYAKNTAQEDAEDTRLEASSTVDDILAQHGMTGENSEEDDTCDDDDLNSAKDAALDAINAVAKVFVDYGVLDRDDFDMLYDNLRNTFYN